MNDEPPTRPRAERTGKHYCVKCLAPVPADEYFRNDHICNACAAQDEYPLASTPEPKPEKKKR
jgi:hypothetical protein